MKYDWNVIFQVNLVVCLFFPSLHPWYSGLSYGSYKQGKKKQTSAPACSFCSCRVCAILLWENICQLIAHNLNAVYCKWPKPLIHSVTVTRARSRARHSLLRPISFLWPYLKAALHSLGVSVVPLSGDGVLLEERRDPLLALGLALAGRLPLSLLQDELLVGGLRLVLVVDGSGHVLPQPEGGGGDDVDLETEN